MSFKNDVIFMGSIDVNLVALILASAKALVFISLFEGFGLPIIESMKSGVPVITSNTSSMPEIAGQAALIVNPYDTNNVAEAMENIDKNEQLRYELIKKGKERIKFFDWETTSNQIFKILKHYNNTNRKI